MLKQIPGGPKKQGIFFNKMLSKFSQFYRYGNFVAINDEFLYAMLCRADLLHQDETGGLIGLTFRINLAGMIFASDVMTNSGYVVPKNRVLSTTDSIYRLFPGLHPLELLRLFQRVLLSLLPEEAAGSHQAGAHRVSEPQEH